MAHPVPMTIADRLVTPWSSEIREEDFSPFDEVDALNEADLQKMRWDVAAGSCALLFDLKGSLCYRRANTAVLLAKGVRGIVWTGESKYGVNSWGTFMVMSSSVTRRSGSFDLALSGLQRGPLVVSAGWMEFWTGDVPGADDAPPDYGSDSDETIRTGLTDWTSPFEPLSRTVARSRS